MTSDLTIVLAEDDDGHATLIRRNIQRASPGARVVRARDGQELLEAIVPGAQAEEAQRVLILLDISMPRVDGMEALRRLKSNPATATIPIYMLTTTDNPVEVDKCFALGCNAYVTKPVAYDAFSAAIEHFCRFLEISQIPGPAARERSCTRLKPTAS